MWSLTEVDFAPIALLVGFESAKGFLVANWWSNLGATGQVAVTVAIITATGTITAALIQHRPRGAIILGLMVIGVCAVVFFFYPSSTTLQNPSAEDVGRDGRFPTHWTPVSWRPGGVLEAGTDHVFSGARSFKLSSDVANHLRWMQTLRLEPNSTYRLSAWIRTENVAHSAEAADYGANIAAQVASPEGYPKHSDGIFGSQDWQQAVLQFSTDERTLMNILLQLGTFSGITTGTAWFDDVELVKEN